MNRNRYEQANPIRIGFFILLFAMFVIILINALLCAIVYDSSNISALSIQQRMEYNTSYYKAETIACEILSGEANELYRKSIESSARIIYNTDAGDIEVINAGNSKSFSIPVSTGENLTVTAVTNGSDIQIVQWSIKKTAQ